MSLLQADTAIAEAEALRRENDALKNRLARLSETSIRISERFDTDAVLSEVIASA